MIFQKQLLSLVGKFLVGFVPGGNIIDLGLQLGVFDWIGKLLVHVLAQRFGLGTDLSTRLVKEIGAAIVKTNEGIKAGTLVTTKDKQEFASSCLKAALGNDPDFSSIQDFDSAGALLIELIYQLQELQKGTSKK